MQHNDSQKGKKRKKKDHRFNRRLHCLRVYRVCVHSLARSDVALLRIRGRKKSESCNLAISVKAWYSVQRNNETCLNRTKTIVSLCIKNSERQKWPKVYLWGFKHVFLWSRYVAAAKRLALIDAAHMIQVDKALRWGLSQKENSTYGPAELKKD